MKFKSLLTILTTLLCITSVYAQQKSVSVKFIDAVTGTPVSGVSVTSSDQKVGSVSDQNGVVSFSSELVKNLTFNVTALGYEPITLTYSQFREEVQLHPKTASLNEVQVNAAGNRIFKTISDLDIHVRPIVNSQEVLRIVPGLFVGQHAGGGKSEQIFLRGFDIDHGTDIQLTLDGIPVNMVSHAHGQGYADLHFVIPEMIDKVDFDKGPYFANKGNFTTAGYVDFKTKDYLPGSFLKLEGGQFKTGRLVTGLNIMNPKTHNGKSLIFGGEASYTRGYFDHSQNFNRFNGLVKYITPVGKKSVLNFSASGFTSKWYASGQIPDRAVEDGTIGWYGAIDPEEGGNTSRVNLNAIYTSYLSNGAVLRNQLFYSYYDFELYSNFTFFLEDPVNGDEIKQKEHRSIIGYNGSYETNGRMGKLPVQTIAGIQYRQDFVSDLELTHTVKRNLLNRIMYGDVNETNISGYVAQTYQLSSKFNITAGLRGDHFINKYTDKIGTESGNANASFISPKLNFKYKVSDAFQVYLYNGRGFHSNDTRVVVPQNGKDILPPAYGNDLGFVWKPVHNLLLQSAFWHLWMEQEFVYVGDAGVVEPGGRTRRLGVDFSARYEPVKNWYVDVNLNWAKPRAIDEAKGEDYIPLAPVFTSIGGITYKKRDGFSGSFRYRYMAERPANEDNSLIAKGYFVTDLQINFARANWEAGISVQNLFDTKWKETQFETESRLFNEPAPVSEIHFTPGTPFFIRGSLTFFF